MVRGTYYTQKHVAEEKQKRKTMQKYTLDLKSVSSRGHVGHVNLGSREMVEIGHWVDTVFTHTLRHRLRHGYSSVYGSCSGGSVLGHFQACKHPWMSVTMY